MAKKNDTSEDLLGYTLKIAKQHAKISQGDAPEDEMDLEDQVDDMWYSFAIPDFENNPSFDGLGIQKLIEKHKLQTVYKEEVTKELKKRYKL